MASGSVIRSQEELERSRSCHSATVSSPATAYPRSSRASPVTFSHEIGLRLCGIADEPFWPAANGSSSSAISVRCKLRISVAIFSMLAPAWAIAHNASAWRSRCTICEETLAGFSPSFAHTYSSRNGPVCARVPTAPEILPTRIDLCARACRSSTASSASIFSRIKSKALTVRTHNAVSTTSMLVSPM
ncbi:MAG: hypothetical protein BWZ10_00568 [candidate division BRC1 bacterium ADurb.BinA364]|nr:MAG: hypothetical protein BWZ10_00568 [candidate division BRC1 bacterium ADurb.BinA364]